MVSPKESLKQKKLLDSFSENIKYIPEDYAEVETDTILSNGFHVHIKTYTDMINGVTIASMVEKDTITKKTIKRELVSEVTVYKDGKELLSKTINKSLFSDIYDYHSDILKDMTLFNIEVNQFVLDDNPNVAHIEINYYREPNMPKGFPEKYFIHYQLIVYEDGKFQIKNV